MRVSIVSPERSLWQGEATLVIARSPEGDFGIMNGHTPFLAALVPGLLTVVSGSERRTFEISGGFLEASAGRIGGQSSSSDYHVIVLADDAKPADAATASA